MGHIKPLPTRERGSPPKRGEHVSDEARWLHNGRYDANRCNGLINWVNYRDKVIVVKFYNGDIAEYAFEDLQGNWTDKLGGMYILE